MTDIASEQLEVSLCLSGNQQGKINLGRVTFVECLGNWGSCKARQPALPMSMEARPAPKGPLLIPLIRILPAILWRSVIIFDMSNITLLTLVCFENADKVLYMINSVQQNDFIMFTCTATA
eukprot:1161442-Pelagomonas_calceolata.AAC.2